MNNNLDNCKYSVLSKLDITVNGVTKLLQNLKPHKAPGPDNIKPLVMKETASTIAPALTAIFKKSLDTEDVPEDWRTANVTPIFKKGTRYTTSNYRPVSLTCISSKLMEHIVLSCIMDHADKNNILYSLQHGFRSSRSCESQLLSFTDDVSKNLNNNSQTDILIMDFSKAFDKVDHSLLCYKLKKYGIRGKINGWIRGFLFNRKQCVVVEGESSSYVPVESGVPQGSVLGPALFLLYINDIPDGLNSTCRLFADDTISYLTVKSNADAKQLQDDLQVLAHWEQRWSMEFHPDKCKVLSISRSKSPIKFEYTLHGHKLEHVTSAKYLGVTFNNKLTWDEHISTITSKANRTLGFLRRNLQVNNQQLKSQAYKKLVRPTVEYASTVWDPYTKKNIDQLERVQRRAARYVHNSYYNTSSVTDMLQKLNWRSLQYRRRDARLCMLYKIHYNLIAIPADCLRLQQRHTRFSHQLAFHTLHGSGNYRKYAFFPRTIREWNLLPVNVIASQSIDCFRDRVSLIEYSCVPRMPEI